MSKRQKVLDIDLSKGFCAVFQDEPEHKKEKERAPIQTAGQSSFMDSVIASIERKFTGLKSDKSEWYDTADPFIDDEEQFETEVRAEDEVAPGYWFVHQGALDESRVPEVGKPADVQFVSWASARKVGPVPPKSAVAGEKRPLSQAGPKSKASTEPAKLQRLMKRMDADGAAATSFSTEDSTKIAAEPKATTDVSASPAGLGAGRTIAADPVKAPQSAESDKKAVKVTPQPTRIQSSPSDDKDLFQFCDEILRKELNIVKAITVTTEIIKSDYLSDKPKPTACTARLKRGLAALDIVCKMSRANLRASVEEIGRRVGTLPFVQQTFFRHIYMLRNRRVTKYTDIGVTKARLHELINNVAYSRAFGATDAMVGSPQKTRQFALTDEMRGCLVDNSERIRGLLTQVSELAGDEKSTSIEALLDKGVELYLRREVLPLFPRGSVHFRELRKCVLKDAVPVTKEMPKQGIVSGRETAREVAKMAIESGSTTDTAVLQDSALPAVKELSSKGGALEAKETRSRQSEGADSASGAPAGQTLRAHPATAVHYVDVQDVRPLTVVAENIVAAAPTAADVSVEAGSGRLGQKGIRTSSSLTGVSSQQGGLGLGLGLGAPSAGALAQLPPTAQPIPLFADPYQASPSKASAGTMSVAASAAVGAIQTAAADSVPTFKGQEMQSPIGANVQAAVGLGSKGTLPKYPVAMNVNVPSISSSLGSIRTDGPPPKTLPH